MSNPAALQTKANGYVIWGLSDVTQLVVGTNFQPAKTKKSNEDLESWLTCLLCPPLHFHFHEITHQDKPVVVLEIPRAHGKPVQFQSTEFIRVGS